MKENPNRTGTRENEITPHIGRGRKKRSNENRALFFGELRRAKQGFKISYGGRARGGASRGSGKIGARVRENSQRVSVKARFVSSKIGRGAKGIIRHLRYLQREGVSQDGGPGKVFNEEGLVQGDHLYDLAREWGEDRHHWRLIVSPERGKDIDLNAFASEYVKALELDLGTKLTWLSSAHYNTDQPHLHLLIRGIRDDGTDLVIARDYVGYGMRRAAETLLTKRLGPRTELEVVEQYKKEATQDRLVEMDRTLIREAKRVGEIDLRPKKVKQSEDATARRLFKLRRLEHLKRLGLAKESEPGKWMISKSAESVLRELGTRGDLIKTMHRELFGRRSTDYVIYSPSSQSESLKIDCRVHSRSISDELGDKTFLIVEALDGKSYWVNLGAFSEPRGLDSKIHSIVQLSPYRPRVNLTKSDVNVFEVSKLNQGIYHVDIHMRLAKKTVKLPPEVSFEEYISVHTQRLERLERRGIIERVGGKSWRIPNDYFERIAKAKETTRYSELVSVEPISPLGVGAQVPARGATWLDSLLFQGHEARPELGAPSTFQEEIKSSLSERLTFLKSLGETIEVNGRITTREGFLDRLYDLELKEAEARLGKEYGYPVRIIDKKELTGSIKSLEVLPSGYHALVVGEGNFSLIPWQRGMERYTQRDKLKFEVRETSFQRISGGPSAKQINVELTLIKRNIGVKPRRQK